MTSDIRETMPVLTRHEGDWAGTYRFVDPDGQTIDHHRSLLHCTFQDDPEFPYFQVNEYTWDDGRTERIEFPARFDGGAITFDTDRIDGRCWEIDDSCLVLHWVYKADATVTLYELIHLDASGRYRTRTWHWFKDGVCFQRTLIDETKVAGPIIDRDGTVTGDAAAAAGA